jgi:hypothetical protein
MAADERLLRLENAFATLVELNRRMEERKDRFNARQSVFQNDLTVQSKMIVELTRAQRHADERLNALIDVVQQGRDGKG